MFKNVASQKVALFAFDITTGAPKTGDGANITPYVSKDYGTVTALGTATATELDSTNAKGWYSFVLTQAETNGDMLLFTAKSSTANVSLVGLLIASQPANWTTASIDGSGRVDVGKTLGTAVTLDTNNVLNVSTKYVGGTLQTARDIGASVLLAAGQKVDVDTIKTNPVVNAGTVTFPTGATLASTTNITAGTIATVTNLTNAPTAGDLTATMKTSVTTAATAATPTAAAVTGAVGSVTGNVGGNVVGTVASVVGAVGSVTGLTASNLDATISSRLATSGYTAPPTSAQNATAVFTTQLTESYAALHTVPTLAQIMFEMRGLAGGKSAATTFLTINKIDGSTPAEVFTMDSATAPTSLNRTT